MKAGERTNGHGLSEYVFLAKDAAELAGLFTNYIYWGNKKENKACNS